MDLRVIIVAGDDDRLIVTGDHYMPRTVGLAAIPKDQELGM
jgi:hypothetical protein